MIRKIKNLIKRILGRGGLQYHIDAVSADMISGWACNTVNPSKPCTVELKTGDKLLASAQAATLREDLVVAAIGNGCHGFSIQLDRLPFSADAREAHLFVNGSRVTNAPIVLKSSFTDILADFATEVEKRMDAMLSIQSERMQREFDYLKNQITQK
jgi:hypothetical protein